MTGAPEVDDALTAMRLGALQYLCKPCPLETVVALVERAAKLHRLARLSPGGEAHPESAALASLRRALERAIESMWMEYQPIVRVSDRRVVAYEALLRTSEAALPHTGAVLEAAERLDCLPVLGRSVRRLVAETFSRVPDDCAVFVNVHAHELRDESLSTEDAPLFSFAERVVFEVAERAGFESARDVRERIERLREMGYRLAVDDLGVGFAGLASFATLEPEFVKLDMSLIRGIHASPMRQKVVRAMIALCNDMGRCVIAEGVEAPAERDQLVELGCDWMQGYLFSKPASNFALPDWG
jgi:EAL domain-containing protein (putative c-di-GMP-specific phosphodiesterase class I)